jgi:hypothetical protein
MLRFVVKHGLVRIIGRRAVPVLLVWDAAVLVNKVRRVPAVDRGLRRGAGAARRGAGTARRALGTKIGPPAWPSRPSLIWRATMPPRPTMPSRPSLPSRLAKPWAPTPPVRATEDTDPDLGA